MIYIEIIKGNKRMQSEKSSRVEFGWRVEDFPLENVSEAKMKSLADLA